jgi:hypothetical protein
VIERKSFDCGALVQERDKPAGTRFLLFINFCLQDGACASRIELTELLT